MPAAPSPATSRFLYRVTGLFRDADTQVRYAEDNRRFIAPALTWQPTNQTSLTLLANYSEEKSKWPFFNLVPPAGSLAAQSVRADPAIHQYGRAEL